MSEDQKFPSQLAERFQIRLPPGLRDRIKAYAEKHGRSMNTEIVRALEEAFPAPWPIDRIVSQILELTEVVRGAASSQAVSALANEIFNAVDGMASGKVTGLSKEERDAVRERFNEWTSHRLEDHYDEVTADMTPEELAEFEKTGQVSRY